MNPYEAYGSPSEDRAAPRYRDEDSFDRDNYRRRSPCKSPTNSYSGELRLTLQCPSVEMIEPRTDADHLLATDQGPRLV